MNCMNSSASQSRLRKCSACSVNVESRIQRVPVVPVALAARRLGQRGRQRRHRRPRRHVGQALDRQRRALDRLAPVVIGHARTRRASCARTASSPPGARWPRPRSCGEPAPRPTTARRTAARPAAAHAGRGSGRPRCPSGMSVCSRIVMPGAGGIGAVAVIAHQRPLAPARGRSRTPGSQHQLHLDADPPGTAPCAPARGRRPRPSGGRVCGVTLSSPRRGPIVSASRTMAHPVGVFHVVTSVFVPGS